MRGAHGRRGAARRRARPASLRATIFVGFVVFVAGAGLAGCGDGGADRAARPRDSLECAWPMFGWGPARTFAYPASCPTELSRTSVARLRPAWFHRTPDVVTATPAVADDSVYVGDWSGNFFALSLADGSVRWRFTAPRHENVYAGQIVSSAAVADAGGERRVFFASGKTLYALAADRGALRWKHELNPEGGADDPTEIESSPVVVGDTVIVGYDGHDDPGTRAGIVALDTATGAQKWNFDPDGGGPPTGCAGVWSSPAVDVERGLVFAGSANCVTAPRGWTRFSEAIFAIDLRTGAPRWTFQPRGPSNFDFDFAGAPNLFEAGGRALVGLGGKDGVYYALDRDRGKLVWKAAVAVPRNPNRNYSTGGFIGASAVEAGIVVGGTAIGAPCPCLHGIDAASGRVVWQQPDAAPTFAASGVVNGVAFSGSTTDFTLRALDLETGAVLWAQQLAGGIAGGVAVQGSTVVAVAGIREPGVRPSGTDSGVYAFTLGDAPAPTSTVPTDATLPPTTGAPPDTVPDPNAPPGPRCIGRPCALSFGLKTPPAGTSPAMTVHLRPRPFRIDVRGEGLGDPNAWLSPGSAAARKGAVTYGVFANDDSLKGSLLCVLDGSFDCVNETRPRELRPNYNRISVLAIANTPELPSASEGFDRLVTTVALEEPVSLR
jgi:polyvinyl alcohol dehydrogenase (cytochrome)